MTQTRFELILTAMAWTGSAAMWWYAWSLCGPTGRARLTFGLGPLAARLRRTPGRHVMAEPKDEKPTYDGEPVRLSRRTEAERAAAYAAMRERASAALAPVSGAPLVEFTEELRRLTESDGMPAVPAALAALREVVHLHAELAQIEADYRLRIDAAVALATGGKTEELFLVPA